MDRDAIRRRDFLKIGLTAGAAASVAGILRAGTVGDGRGLAAVAAESLDELFAGHNLYWGDLHGHTGYSDGFGTPSAFHEYGRARQGLDFAAISDHAEWIGFHEKKLRMSDGSPVPLWANLIAEVEAQNVPGSFVTFPGFEWTSDVHGHRTVVFGSTAPLPPTPPSAQSHPTPSDLWAALSPYVAMTIPHHVTRWGHRMDWRDHNPQMERLVEIYSKWGNGASVWTSYDLPTRYRQYPFLRKRAAASGVDAMLERGYRIGIVAASDSHQGHPGSTATDDPLGAVLPSDQNPVTGEGFLEALDQGYTVDLREPWGGGGGLAAVWARDLTLEAIWEGLHARCTLGTSGIRPIVKFGVCDGQEPGRGAVMGSELTVAGSPVLLASAIPEPGSAVTGITLLRTNTPLLAATDPEPGVAVSFRDDRLAIGETACYRALVVVRQQPEANLDGDTILKYNRRRNRFFQSTQPRLEEQVWTSPLWVTRVAT